MISAAALMNSQAIVGPSQRGRDRVGAEEEEEEDKRRDEEEEEAATQSQSISSRTSHQNKLPRN